MSNVMPVISPPYPAVFLALAAADEAALQQQAALMAQFLPGATPAVPSPGPWRLATWGDTADDLHARLAAFVGGTAISSVHMGEVRQRPSLAFLCTGQGAQYPGMGRDLYQSDPVFRAALDECADLLRPYLPLPLLEVIFPPDVANPATAVIHETGYTQPALFALEYALAQRWLAWGVRPAVLLGHSVGEYVAACLAGVFSLADGLKLIAARGRLMGALPPGGAMAAVFAAAERVETAVAPYADRVSLAAANGPTNTVISGEATAVARILAALKADKIRARPLVVSHAFHSPLMEPMLAEFTAVAATITYHPPAIPIISNVTGQPATANDLVTPDYWREHVRAAVQFAPAVQALYAQKVDIFLEIGPQPHLIGMAARIPSAGSTPLLLPSLRPEQPDWPTLLSSLATLYVQGVDIH